ncbi:hypothetical protein [Nocardia wallacei]|uniref:hypothetical protein n=1 Tax=Nocardia wallacei TaxID=480035 RepID=UPI0024543583|nr:hypothetical protein [Nocardia wallacei]
MRAGAGRGGGYGGGHTGGQALYAELELAAERDGGGLARDIAGDAPDAVGGGYGADAA